MPPINPMLLKNGAQFIGRVAQQAGKAATTAAPGLAEKATGATARLAAKTMSGLGGLNARLPSQLPTGATLQAGIAGLRPRLQNAQLLGKMGRLGQAAQAQLGQLGQLEPLGQMRHAVQSALQNPMAAALQGSDRASRTTSDFLQAMHDVENNARYQDFAPPVVARLFGEARSGLQAIHDMIQQFQSGLGRLAGGPKPSPAGAMPAPPTLPPRPTQPVTLAPPKPTLPLAIEDKPKPVSLMDTEPGQAIQSLRERGVDLKSFMGDLHGFQTRGKPSRDEMTARYGEACDIGNGSNPVQLRKFFAALTKTVRAEEAG
ncbi:hypothetical protein [Rhizobacter sp. OV335]|uniref:hypothetical protein n=1 Tax=Rhizobacter sp. OV335 TaxID=1500264 RepID=UPI00091A93C2|nr:hypothetical protein [Rhizobacter sp. OV335]SHN21907.1 hypothetical protein SAMN02787076_04156 [Rhizobacter sp. OV335]